METHVRILAWDWLSSEEIPSPKRRTLLLLALVLPLQGRDLEKGEEGYEKAACRFGQGVGGAW